MLSILTVSEGSQQQQLGTGRYHQPQQGTLGSYWPARTFFPVSGILRHIPVALFEKIGLNSKFQMTNLRFKDKISYVCTTRKWKEAQGLRD